jgi:hypothetical protein
LTKIAIFEAVGTISRSVSIILPTKFPGTKVARPAMLPPGRDRLWTRPILTGSATPTNTIGMLAVVDFRATADCRFAAISRSGLRATSWQMILGPAVTILDDQFHPSIQPRFRKPTLIPYTRAVPTRDPRQGLALDQTGRLRGFWLEQREPDTRAGVQRARIANRIRT